MEGRGGVLGCLKEHCVECSHLLLHLSRAELERGILFHGWILVSGVEHVVLEPGDVPRCIVEVYLEEGEHAGVERQGWTGNCWE